MGIFSFTTSKIKVEELQKKTGKSYNECSSALNLADGDVEKAIKILRNCPEQDHRVKPNKAMRF